METLRELRESVDDYISIKLGLDITAKDKWGSNVYLSTMGIKLQIQDFKNIGYWFRPQVLIDLQIMKNWFCEAAQREIYLAS